MLIDERGRIVDFIVDDQEEVLLRGVRRDVGVCEFLRHVDGDGSFAADYLGLSIAYVVTLAVGCSMLGRRKVTRNVDGLWIEEKESQELSSKCQKYPVVLRRKSVPTTVSVPTR